MDNISTLINYMALVYIALPIVAILFLIIYRKKITSWVAIMDFGKWYIASVAVVFLAKMVEASFTERETGIKEIEIFGKYSNVMLKTDSVDQAWTLARYFSIVTPTERLRSRWKELRDTLQISYMTIQQLQHKADSLKKGGNLDSAEAVNNRISNIRQSFVLAVKDPVAARSSEAEGFQALLNKDIDGAIVAFNNSERSYNGFHMVYELSRYLRNYKDKHSAYDWNEIYTNVLSICAKYKGTIPDDVKTAMEDAVKSKG